jgi:hypothetical protein
MKTGFYLTWESVTDESAEIGDASDRGYCINASCEIAARGLPGALEPFSLRHAIRSLHYGTTTGELTSIDVDLDESNWVTASFGRDLHTGEFESITIHLPMNLTLSTRKRIVRLAEMGVY